MQTETSKNEGKNEILIIQGNYNGDLNEVIDGKEQSFNNQSVYINSKTPRPESASIHHQEIDISDKSAKNVEIGRAKTQYGLKLNSNRPKFIDKPILGSVFEASNHQNPYNQRKKSTFVVTEEKLSQNSVTDQKSLVRDSFAALLMDLTPPVTAVKSQPKS